MIASWGILSIICALSAIPAIGFLAWIIATPVIFIAVILGIVTIANGRTMHGVMILLASLIVAPVIIMVAPVVSTAILAAPAAFNYDRSADNRTFQQFTNPHLDDTQPDTLSLPTATPKSTTSSTQKISGIGKIADAGDFTIALLEANPLGEMLPRGHRETTGQYLHLRYQIKNSSKQNSGPILTPFVRDSLDRVFDEIIQSEKFIPKGEKSLIYEDLPLGRTKVFSSIFEVPAGETNFTFIARSAADPDKETLIPFEVKLGN